MTPDNYYLENPKKVLKSPTEGNLYSYAINNPISMIDSSGDDAYLFIDRQGAGGKGHTGVMVGNKKIGYNFYSQGATNANSITKLLVTGSVREGVGKIYGKTPQQALSKMTKADPNQKYDQFIKFKTTESQDLKMMSAADKRVEKPRGYNLLMNNCSDFCHSVLKTGNVDVKDFTVKPNTYFNNAAEGRQVKDIDHTPGVNNFKD